MAKRSSSRASTSSGAAVSDLESVFGHVLLIQGPEALIADRHAEQAVAAARAQDPSTEITRTSATDIEGGDLSQMTAGSLFAASSIIVVDHIAEASESLNNAVLAHAAAPSPEVALVLIHRGGNKNKGLLDKVKKAGAHHLSAAPLKGQGLVEFVMAETRRQQARIDTHVARRLVEAVGTDLRTLAQAVRQLVEDAEDATIRDELVDTYFQGRAEVKGFAIADAVVAGRTAAALEALRWALDTGTAPVQITSAVASSLRQLARLSGAGRGRDADVGAEIGAPYWKVRQLRETLRSWSQETLAQAIVAVARTDADVKGGADDPHYALESLVLTVTALARRPAGP